MSHITPEMLGSADDRVFAHLETCDRCRSHLTSDVDLDVVLARILDSVGSEPPLVRSGRGGWRPRPSLVVAGAAALVTALFVPLLWLSDGGNTNVAGPTPTLAEPTPTPPEPPPPPEPPISGDISSFELTFETEDGVFGRLIWGGPTFYEGIRASQSSQKPVYDYGFYRAGTEAGLGSETFSPFDEERPLELPEDPVVPWKLLLERLSVEDMWTALGGELPLPEGVEPTHPDADLALSADGLLLEATNDGIPLLIASDSTGFLRVTSFDRRPIRAGEVGNNIDLPFMYALYLAVETTDEQWPVLADGIVTFSDYESAVQSAAQCAGVEPVLVQSTGMFALPANELRDECVARHLGDIEEVWRVDSQFLIDDFEVLWATVEGRDDLVELYSATEGAVRDLGIYSLRISQRSPGYCLRYGIEGTYSEWCFLETDMSIPSVLIADIAIRYTESRPDSGSIAGIVTDDVDRIVVSFESGDPVEVIPGETIEFGYRGYAYVFDASDVGEPTTVEVFSGARSLGVYSHTEGKAVESQPDSSG